MDYLEQCKRVLGSPDLVVLTADDMDRLSRVLYAAEERGALTEDERFSVELVMTVNVEYPAETGKP